MEQRILWIGAVMVAGIGTYTDLKTHKIYNKLTIRTIMIGLVLNMFLRGIKGLADSVLGILLGSVMGVFWILGMLKAGDIKLYMAVGALAGWRFCGYTWIASVLFGGVVAAGLMMVRKTGRTALRRLKEYALNILYTRTFYTYEPTGDSGYFSFGGCIFVGTLVALWKLWGNT